jgi:hypothetical protein
MSHIPLSTPYRVKATRLLQTDTARRHQGILVLIFNISFAVEHNYIPTTRGRLHKQICF